MKNLPHKKISCLKNILFYSLMIFLSACTENPDVIEPSIAQIFPESDGSGVEIHVIGQGFGTDVSSVTVRFNGVVAPTLNVSDSLVVTKVPIGASTGKITIQVNDQQIESAQDFVVLKGIWTQKSSVPFEKGFGSGVGFAFGDKGILGTGSDNGSFLDLFWEYDPENDQWTSLNFIPNGGRHFCTSFILGDYAYVGLGRKDGELSVSKEFYRYHVISNTWSNLGDFTGTLPSFIDLRVGFSSESKGYIIIENNVWEYNPSTDGWTKKNDYPGSGTSGLVAEVVGGYAYVGLGFNNAFDWWRYDLQNNQWLQLSDYPGSISWDLQSFQIDNKIYIVGKESWEYDPQTEQWIQRTSHPEGRRFASTFSIKEKGYVAIGISMSATSSPFTNDLWEFELN